MNCYFCNSENTKLINTDVAGEHTIDTYKCKDCSLKFKIVDNGDNDGFHTAK